MNFLNKLDKKYGKYAIANLMTYIIFLNGVTFLLSYISPSTNIVGLLTLEPSLVLKGEIWRLITFIFIPPETSILWVIFVLYFYYLVGTGIEQEWGSFKFNMYYLVGILATIAAAFISGFGATATYLNLSLFLAFAYIYPNYELLLFFILPVKVKYLAWLNWVIIGFSVLFRPIPLKAAALASVINFFIFFGKDIIKNVGNKKTVYNNRKRFDYNPSKKDHMHKCTVCGVTEKDNPNMEFRYCTKCDGYHEYCMDHLSNHEHIKENK